MSQAAMALKRGPPEAHRFKPGQSGNPGGRPKKLAELYNLAATNFPQAVQALGELLKSEDEALRLQAVQFAYLYTLGKPPEGTDLVHLESMRQRLAEVVVHSLPEVAPDALPPNSVPELVQEPLTTSPVPPEAAGVVTASVLREEPVTPPPSEPSGFVMTPERQAFLEQIKPPEYRLEPALGGMPHPDVMKQAVPHALAGGVESQRDKEPAVSQGLRCLFRGRDGQCSELAQDGKQWCPGHLAKLFEVAK